MACLCGNCGLSGASARKEKIEEAIKNNNIECRCAACNEYVIKGEEVYSAQNYKDPTKSVIKICKICYRRRARSCDASKGCGITFVFPAGMDSSNKFTSTTFGDDYTTYKICLSCYNQKYFACYRCCHSYNLAEKTRFRNNDCCANCFEYVSNAEFISSMIRDYSYKPSWNTFAKVRELKYGVELEVSCKDTFCKPAGDALKWPEHVCFKRDSTIANGGIEMVSHPHSLEQQYELWNPFFELLEQDGIRQKYNLAADENGMHIHVGRSCLNKLTIGKIVAFCNSSKNKNFVTTIAERDTARWAKLDPAKGVTNTTDFDRYVAVNLTNQKTIEFRIFRGTLNKRNFFKNLEFCDCLINFCRNTSIEALSAQDFLTYLVENKKSYKNLYRFLLDAGLVTAEVKKENKQKEKENN